MSINSQALFRKARLSRDARFDGSFFIAVKTTGIYCRPICPAPSPKECNVEYFSTSIAALNHGYRPCLRCRPDSAPGSSAWKGNNTSFDRAISLINEGVLTSKSVCQLAERLGISSRYLNTLFRKNLGTSVKNYAQHQQLMFAKSLLQQTSMSITDIAFASGFKSLRRFNDCFQKKLKLTPSNLRKNKSTTTNQIRLFLSYRPPYAWLHLRDFLQKRAISPIEWTTKNSYGRTFSWRCNKSESESEFIYGQFTATHDNKKHGFKIKISISDINYLMPIINNIRRILDLDAAIENIDEQLQGLKGFNEPLCLGLRVPGTWDLFEAGVRAILGQQISVIGALKLVSTLVERYGIKKGDMTLFPTPKNLLSGDLTELKMPNSRRETLKNFSRYMKENPKAPPDNWLEIKGIGPWTVAYAKMRGLSNPNIWLGSDLVIKKVVAHHNANLKPENASPWQSYLTLQIWNL